VVSARGDSIEGDLVVVATGVRPNTHLASTSGLAVNYAIEVDEYMETSVKGIYAAGDCMEYNGICHDIIPWAVSTSRIAAKNIMEPKSAILDEFIPFNTLKVVGIDLTSIGLVNPESTEYESIVQVDRESGNYFKGVIKDEKLVGGIAIGNKKVAEKLRKLINTGSDVSDQKRTLFELD
jgi:nitrite reductase (NADH) large subunit